MPDPVKTEEETKSEVASEEHDEELVKSVQAKLDALNGITPDSEEKDDDTDDNQAEDSKVDDDSTPKDDDDDDDGNEDDSKQAEEGDDDDDSTPEDDSKKEKKDVESGKEVTLPDAYHRAAVHQGWEPDEIKEFFEATPELAVKTFAKILQSTNKITSEFAKLGRVRPSKEPVAKTATEDTEVKAKTQGDSVDLTALKEQYGDDSAVVKVFAAMQEKLDAAVVVKPQVDVEQEVEELDPVVKRRIDNFFVDPTLKPYTNFYGEGKNAAKLTIEQSDNRWKVLETAESIMVGYHSQGREVSLEQALESAHLLISEPVREEALRTELKAKVVKRAKGVSLKPAKSKAIAPDKNAKPDEKDMLAKTQARLNKVFG